MYKLIILGVSIIFSAMADANVCQITSLDSLKEKLLMNHPLILQNFANDKGNQYLIQTAKERPNPNLQFQILSGNEIDGKTISQQFSYMHTFERGDKRETRIQFAQTKRTWLKLNDIAQNEDLLIDAILKAYRSEHIKKIIPVLEEALSTFKKIKRLREKQKVLDPEEEVELETINLVINDYALKVHKLEAENLFLSKHLQFFLNDCKIKSSIFGRSNLNKLYQVPQIEKESTKILIAKTNLKKAKNNIRVQESLGHANVQVGPMLQATEIEGKHYQSFGISLNMNLNILNQNTGLIKQAYEEYRQAKKRLANITFEEKLDLNSWIVKSKSLTKQLEIFSSDAEVLKKHKRIEKLFARGLISTPLVIEAHRQLVDYSQGALELEFSIAEANLNILRNQGLLIQENL